MWLLLKCRPIAGLRVNRRPAFQKKATFGLLVLCLAFLISGSGSAQAFTLEDIEFNEHHDPFLVYNYILPDLMRFAAFSPHDPPETKILKSVRYVNFFTTINRYEYRVGKRFLKPYAWWDHLSYALASSHLLCSEQAAVAALMLLPWFPEQAFRDVQAHTFYEVNLKNRWIIVDPMFDMRLRNKKNLLASFADIRAFLEGDTKSLRLPAVISPRMRDYLNRFDKECVEQNKLKRHPYGENILAYDKDSPFNRYDLLINFENKKQLLKYVSDHNFCNYETMTCKPYLMFIRNHIHKAIKESPDRKKTIYMFQDYFLDEITRTHMGRKEIDHIYFAMNYMWLGRLDVAEKYLKNIDNKDEQVYYFLSLIHFLRYDRESFNSCLPHCKDNIYYKYLYWQINGEYFLDSDPEDFKSCWSKAYGLDLMKVDKPFRLQVIQ